MSRITIIICKDCNSRFTAHHHGAQETQKRCPRCQAEMDSRIKSIPLTRQAIFHDVVRVDSLPGEWVLMPPKRPHDAAYYKIDVSGRDIAEGFCPDPPVGRIVINAQYPVKVGDIVKARIIRAFHDTKDGQREMREYMALDKCRPGSYPAWSVNWELDNWHSPNDSQDWVLNDEGIREKEVWGNGNCGILRLSPLQAQEPEFEYEEDNEELLGESALALLRGLK